ncbi:alanine/glycine:cation symporter family protein [Xanthovirga aplysinae]|uniref:alanine/glycine:cation symporter family protein n=1 Tax=Xanthovirga aplysinae TaxID=2529853 RepID=UPI0012BC1AC9|nr:alanine/glycine:cation symporter family protein [Xanthovirga aplysinae]MTI30134.1 alanine:cation symporter family protein [Xanthovirga aplysinae]
MKKVLLSILSLTFLVTPHLQAAPVKSVDDQINDAISPITAFMERVIFVSFKIGPYEIPFILLWLIGGALFFTFYLKFINIRGLKHAIDIIKGKYSKEDDPGEVTHFQALTAALSGTVGLGNIAGVAVAISLGGPGATFWMIIGGFIGMTTKFVECTLAVKYRNIHADGSVSGGPMHYLDKGLSAKGYGRLGKFLAMFFALMCIGGALGAGNMFQVNQAAHQFVGVFGGESTFFGQHTWVFGLIMSLLAFIVIVGGFKSIAKVTDKVVPLMCAVYVIGGITVLLANFSAIPSAFTAIIEGAFNGKAIAGGAVGVMLQGLRRAAFSNEAGLGSAAIAHSTAKTSKPITEGFVASIEPVIDTVIVCTMTALVIVITGAYHNPEVDGIALTSSAFASVISWFPYVLSIAVILFAFSTMISWSYYGLKSWTYLFGKSKFSELSFKLLFCLFIVIGASMSFDRVIGISDAMIFAMSFPNVIGLYFLAPVVKKELKGFLSFVKKEEKENEKVTVSV